MDNCGGNKSEKKRCLGYFNIIKFNGRAPIASVSQPFPPVSQ